MDLRSFSSYFNETIVDNNGVAVSDVNAGIKKLYENIILPSDSSDYELVVLTDEDKCNPDLIAHKHLGDQRLWYYFLLTNALEDPFKELELGWAYGIVDTTNADQSTDLESEDELKETSRIGKVLTLN